MKEPDDLVRLEAMARVSIQALTSVSLRVLVSAGCRKSADYTHGGFDYKGAEDYHGWQDWHTKHTFFVAPGTFASMFKLILGIAPKTVGSKQARP
jgi:hypothetical protein